MYKTEPEAGRANSWQRRKASCERSIGQDDAGPRHLAHAHHFRIELFLRRARAELALDVRHLGANERSAEQALRGLAQIQLRDRDSRFRLRLRDGDFRLSDHLLEGSSSGEVDASGERWQAKEGVPRAEDLVRPSWLSRRVPQRCDV